MSWQSPKTDWVATDSFNIEDYNRIKNNLQSIYEESQDIFGEYSIIDMGDDMTDYSAYWRVEVFNAFENNLDTINQHMLNDDIGIKRTFYENGVFITYDELNRIESACLRLHRIIDGWYEGMTKLPFRVGAKREIKG